MRSSKRQRTTDHPKTNKNKPTKIRLFFAGVLRYKQHVMLFINKQSVFIMNNVVLYSGTGQAARPNARHEDAPRNPRRDLKPTKTSCKRHDSPTSFRAQITIGQLGFCQQRLLLVASNLEQARK